MSKVYQIFADSLKDYIWSNNPVVILQYLGYQYNIFDQIHSINFQLVNE